MNHTIKVGPFAGTVVPLHQLVQAPDGNALLWPVAERYPLFRTVFPAEAGWSLSTTRETLPDRMPAYDEIGLPYRKGDEVLLFPAMLITATLSDPSGRTVADATTLVELGSRKAYETGENNARSRLFESLGLPAAFDPRLFSPAAAELAGSNVTLLPQANAGNGARVPRSSPMPTPAPDIKVTSASFQAPAEPADTAKPPVIVTEVAMDGAPAAVSIPNQSRPTQRAASSIPAGLSAAAISRARQAAARAGHEFQLEAFKSNAELMAFATRMGEEARRAAKAAEAGAA